MFEHKIEVSGRIVTLRPYTEKRMKLLAEVNKEIAEFVKSNPDMRLDDVPAKKKAGWWMRKAAILWKAEPELGEDFFTDENFESSRLKESEDFFMSRRLYL